MRQLRIATSFLAKDKLEEILTSLRADELSSLELCGVGLQPSDVALISTAIRGNRKLTALELGGNPQLGDAGVRALAPGLRECGLSVLGLDGSSVGDIGGKEIAAALRGGAKLTTLKLQHNTLTDASAVELADAARSARVRTLLLQRNKIGDKGAAALEKAVEEGKMLIECDLKYNLVTRPRLLARIDAACRANTSAAATAAAGGGTASPLCTGGGGSPYRGSPQRVPRAPAADSVHDEAEDRKERRREQQREQLDHLRAQRTSAVAAHSVALEAARELVRIGKREDAAHAQGAATAAAASARKDRRRAAAAAIAAARDGDVSSDDGSPFPHQRHRLRTLRNAKTNQQPATREPSKSPVGERSKAGGGSSRNGGETADLWGAVAGILMPASPPDPSPDWSHASQHPSATKPSATSSARRPTPPASPASPDKPRHQPSPQQDRSPSKRELTPSSKASPPKREPSTSKPSKLSPPKLELSPPKRELSHIKRELSPAKGDLSPSKRSAGGGYGCSSLFVAASATPHADPAGGAPAGGYGEAAIEKAIERKRDETYGTLVSQLHPSNCKDGGGQSGGERRMSDGEGTDARLARCLELVREIAADNLADYVADIASPRGSAAPSAPPSVPASRSASPPPGFPVTTGQIEVRWLRRELLRATFAAHTSSPTPPADYVALTSSCRQIALHSRPLAPWFCDFRLLAGARASRAPRQRRWSFMPRRIRPLPTPRTPPRRPGIRPHARQPPKPWMRIGSTTELMEASTAAPGSDS